MAAHAPRSATPVGARSTLSRKSTQDAEVNAGRESQLRSRKSSQVASVISGRERQLRSRKSTQVLNVNTGREC